MSVLLETSAGDLVIDLDIDKAAKSCTNFLKLCKIKYYNFSPFYNVHRDFTAQSGDPNYPDGDGGESIWGGTFRGEMTQEKLQKGDVAMALSDGQAGSQFVVVLSDQVDHGLDDRVGKFGTIVEGLETLDKINTAYCDDDNRPLKDIRIKHTYILDDPYEDPPGVDGERESPEPTERQLATVRLDADDDEDQEQDDDDGEGGSKRQRDQKARAQALTLEMVGDLPFAEVKPQENVLFVCKLNPVTSDEDLQLIFSRFGKIVSCEVIRDTATGESLQYAFIEFENKQDCERAYFKMEGVLIDDRRIHVDFSQSVSRLSDSWRSGQNSKRQRAHGSKFQRSGSRGDNDSLREYNHDHGRRRDDDHRGSRRRHGNDPRDERTRHRDRDDNRYYHRGSRDRDRDRGDRERQSSRSHHHRSRHRDRDYDKESSRSHHRSDRDRPRHSSQRHRSSSPRRG